MANRNCKPTVHFTSLFRISVIVAIGIGFIPLTTRAQSNGGDPQSGKENCQPCSERSMGVTHTSTIAAPPFLNDAMYKLSKLIEKLPFVVNCHINVAGQLTVETGNMCCDDAKCVDPVEYIKMGGGVNAEIKADLTPPVCAHGLYGHGESPIHWRFIAAYVIGPVVTLNPQVTASVTGTQSSCGKCLTAGVDATIGVGLALEGEIKGQVIVFEEGHWYSIDADAEASASASGSTSIEGGVDYATGGGCSKQGITASHASIGKVVAKGSYSMSVEGWSFTHEWSCVVWNGKEL